MVKALIFDVDGTLAETEEGHREAFNSAFAETGLDWVWDVDLYRDLHRVTGGKERMRHYADRLGVSHDELTDAALAKLHRLKNERYSERVRAGRCPLRPGVERLIRASHARGLRLAICTTTSRVNVNALIEATFGAEGFDCFEAIVAGEDARAKKPAPGRLSHGVESARPTGRRVPRVRGYFRNGLLAARAA